MSGAHPWTVLPALVDRLDACLAGAVDAAALRFGFGPGADPYRGLYVGDDEVRRLLTGVDDSKPVAADSWPILLGPPGREDVDPFDAAVLMVAIAPEVDLKYERIYGYLQDDVSKRRPTVSLALDLFCPDFEARVHARERFAPDAALRTSHRLDLMGTDADPLLARPFRADPQWIRHLLGGTGLDERVAAATERIEPGFPVEHLPLEADLAAVLAGCVADARSGRPVRLGLLGDDADTLALIASGLAASVPSPLIRVRPSLPVDRALLATIVADCRMLDLALHLPEPTDPLAVPLADSDQAPLTIVTTSDPSVRSRLAVAGYRTAEVPRPDDELRRRWWSMAAAATDVDDSVLDTLAARYRLTATQIRSVVTIADSTGAPGHRPGAGALTTAARTIAAEPLQGQAERVPITAAWVDLVLPDTAIRHLHELCDRVVHRTQVLDGWGMRARTAGRRGVNALFAGPSGTGKTMAAQVVAGALDLELFAIDLSVVVSKYIGETEKNLDRIFAAAAHADAVLFFDEADALFGKRSEVKDSHDRYANLEVSYLLQKMESHDGVAVLATNLRQNLDEAFLRRLAFTVHFPFPEPAERLRIWAHIWPRGVPLHPDVDLDELARRYTFSGGNIRDVALASAFRAASNGTPVTMTDVVAAADAEYVKLGAQVTPRSVRHPVSW